MRSGPRAGAPGRLVIRMGALCAVATAPFVAAQAAPPLAIVNVDARVTTSLDGPWHAIVDAFDNGYYDYRYQPRQDGFFLDRKPRDESDLVEYDFDHVRALDATRLVTAALERGKPEGDTQVIDDPFGRHLDVIGCNQYVGWYDGLPEKADRVAWRSAYDKPHVISEWGGGARAGLHGASLQRWTEEFQELVYRKQTRMLDRIPFLAGTTPWLLMDFRSPRRVLPGVQDGWNRKGVVSDRGQRKKAFLVLQQWYTERAERERSDGRQPADHRQR